MFPRPMIRNLACGTSARILAAAFRNSGCPLPRGSEYPPTTIHVFSSSDKTGFVAVARGKNKSGTDIHGVGRGTTQAEADQKALELLNGSGAGAEQKIIYRYFSYGAD